MQSDGFHSSKESSPLCPSYYFFSSIIVIMSRGSDEEYFELEPGNLLDEDVKKYKKEDDKSYEYFVAKVRFVA